ncbi:MAG: hypothetical protein EZS28_028754 [Streblomastix strix]|uniref:Uncharacterized protein n=1 Tax=Streblomastix strix TaxID=222440 RepID=A0A5J4UZ72_9EUKA|nr:MAG: hypothetical protein EZS28_028754 [Streblomastix strix]
MTTTIITIIMILTMTRIIDMTENRTSGTISQIWDEEGKGREQYRMKVQAMDKTMMIGQKVYTAKFRDHS